MRKGAEKIVQEALEAELTGNIGFGRYISHTAKDRAGCAGRGATTDIAERVQAALVEDC